VLIEAEVINYEKERKMTNRITVAKHHQGTTKHLNIKICYLQSNITTRPNAQSASASTS
jgi:hypothetical protein